MDKNRLFTPLAKDTYYSAFKANDARFDGRVYLGVSSTGIYCRPVCRAKMPKKENCSFYGSAPAAEAAGYRPCLLCRPELAPGYAPVDASARIVQKAVRYMEDGFLFENSLQALSRALNVSDRHLRRVFLSEYGFTPIQYWQTSRLLLAKSMLTDTDLPVTQIAYAAGFGSVRRFNTLFKERYRMSPSKLRKQMDTSPGTVHDSVTLYLGYRPPYLWNHMLSFLESRAIPGVETVRDEAYHRTVAIAGKENMHFGFITVRHAEIKNALAVTLPVTLLPVLSIVLARVKRLFDLYCDPMEVYQGLSCMNEIKEGICTPGLRLPGSFDPFEMAVRAVLGQQITVKGARTLAGRIASTYGTLLKTPVIGLTHTFPSAAVFCAMAPSIEEHLGSLGVTGARARSIGALAAGIVNGSIDLSSSADPGVQMERLLNLPGFGPWTVQYIAMGAALGGPMLFPIRIMGSKRPWRRYRQRPF